MPACAVVLTASVADWPSSSALLERSSTVSFALSTTPLAVSYALFAWASTWSPNCWACTGTVCSSSSYLAFASL